jgi:N6-L-threonylcarbamoyladenine synthase
MLAARERPLTDERRADIARGVQEAIVETLVGKSLRAMEDPPASIDLVVAGGVGANRLLRERLEAGVGTARRAAFTSRGLEFCTDNAAMIAMAGMLRLSSGAMRRFARHPGAGAVAARPTSNQD